MARRLGLRDEPEPPHGQGAAMSRPGLPTVRFMVAAFVAMVAVIALAARFTRG